MVLHSCYMCGGGDMGVGCEWGTRAEGGPSLTRVNHDHAHHSNPVPITITI